MARVEMKRVEIYGKRRDRKKILEFIHKRELMEFFDVGDGIEKADTAERISQLDAQLASAAEAISILSEYCRDGFGVFKQRPTVDADGYGMNDETARRAEEHIKRVINVRREISAAEEKIEKIILRRKALLPYLSLDVPAELSETEKTVIKIGSLEGKWDRERILTELSHFGLTAAHVEIISTEKSKAFIWLVYPQGEEPAARRALERSGFCAFEADAGQRTPREAEKALAEKIQRLSEEKGQKVGSLEECAKYLDEIKLFYDRLTLRRERYEALSHVGLTENTFLMCGYIPKNSVDAFVKEASARFLVHISAEDAKKDASVPVAFSNNPIVAPVERITADYSMPSEHDIDPNPVMAVFYYLFFGMMFSDAGYGLMLMLVCGILGFGKILEREKREKFRLFFFCGISTTFWGLMYGSFFGDLPATVSRTFGRGELSLRPILLDPTKKPLELLIISVAFGAVHILTALFIKFYMTWRAGRRADAVCDVGFWIAVIFGAGAASAGAGLSWAAVSRLGAAIMLLGVSGIVLYGGRKNKNIFLRLLGGVLSLYDATAFVGDILSYSRLMALGLATGVIASVINILGSLGGNTALGLIIYVVVSVVGHTLNLAINMLGAYVHTNRLQYVEFYQKFYEGGGRSFSPLSMRTKYHRFLREREQKEEEIKI